jgi:glycolate dehydrogenase FAD-binding subunit
MAVPGSFHDDLRRIVGPAHVLTGIECGPYVVEGRTPEAVVAPGSKEDIAAILMAAGEAGVPVTPWGGGTTMAVGSPPSRLGLVLLLGRLNRLVEHEPGDLTATVEAGMIVRTLQEALLPRGQWLSLDPPHSDKATIGGILSANVAGPRRHLYGGCRDLLIGLTVVTADGAIVKGGGKVVKNVAGYDLPKLFIGAFGTLGVIVEATLKLRPRPDADRVVVARFERLKDAGAAARAVMASDLLPSALELIDGEAVRALALGASEGAALLVGVDGIAEQVDWQCREIERLLEPMGLREARVLDGAERDRLWHARGTVGRDAFADTAATMRWAMLPSQVAECMEQGAAVAQRAGLGAAMAAHAGVGLVEAALGGGAHVDLDRVAAVLGEWRALVRGAGGHAIVQWAPLAVKERVPVWDEAGPALRIMARIKAQLDPRGVLNPGRVVGGI